jgi:hypothetical protein
MKRTITLFLILMVAMTAVPCLASGIRVEIRPGDTIPEHWISPGVTFICSRSKAPVAYVDGNGFVQPYSQGYGQCGQPYSQGYDQCGQGYDQGYNQGYGQNQKIRSHERWDQKGGEREFEQSPSVPAALIDAVKTLGAAIIIFR